MTAWRYVAVPLPGSGETGRRAGEVAGETAAAVRRSLRRAGLQVVELRPVRRGAPGGGAWREAWRAHLRRRRVAERADLYDALATLLASGLPLLEALDTAQRAAAPAGLLRRGGARRAMLVQVRDAVRSGAPFAQALAEEPGWFDPAEVAMVAAGEHGGDLAGVLRTMSVRHERSGELAQRLVAALAYPSVVAVVGLAVVVFLSTRTLPGLLRILVDAGVEPPALTMRVVAFGGFVAAHGAALALGVAALVVAALVAPRALAARGWRAPAWAAALTPRVARRIALAQLSARLGDLVRSGVPLGEALRVLAPTTPAGLRARVLEAAAALEEGRDLSAAMADERWFDPEFRRLLAVGQASGELDALLERIGRRYLRQADRLVDRLAALLEPAVVLALAFLVGVVVVAAVLPLVRLQEVLA